MVEALPGSWNTTHLSPDQLRGLQLQQQTAAVLPRSFLALACEGWPMSKLMDLRVLGLIWPTVG